MKKHILKNILKGVAAAAAFALASCSFLSLDDDSGSSSGSGSERGAVSVSMFVPDYYAISAGTSARVVAPQTNSVRLGYKAGAAAEYTYLDAISLTSDSVTKTEITGADTTTLSGYTYKFTFSGIPAVTYAADALVVELLDSSNNVVSSGTNSGSVTIEAGGKVSASFYTIPTSSDAASGSLSAGEMKFAKVAVGSGIESVLEVTVGSEDSYPTIFLFNSDGTYNSYKKLSSEDNTVDLKASDGNNCYYIGIYSETGLTEYKIETTTSISAPSATSTTGVNPDADIVVSASSLPTTVTIYNGETLVDTISSSGEKLYTGTGSGVSTINVKDQLIQLVDSVVVVKPHFASTGYGLLDYNTTYTVKFDDVDVLTFTTRESAPTISNNTINVGSSSDSDFATIQGAFNYITQNDTDGGSWTINVAAGSYHERLYYKGSANVTLAGPEDSGDYGDKAVVYWKNNDAWNTGTRVRTNFLWEGENLTLKNLTLKSTYLRTVDGGSSNDSTEVMYFDSRSYLVAYNCSFLGHQDTLILGNNGGRAWFYKDYIEGDVDFIWGAIDVALFEECQIHMTDDDGVNNSYIFASRTVTSNEVNKGFVLYNSNVSVDDGVAAKAYYGRNSGSDTQASVINSTFSTVNSALWASAGADVLDIAGDAAIAYKDYGNTLSDGTAISTASRLDKTYTLSDRVVNREYNGRWVILNRGYNATDEVYTTASKIWDISSYESEFGATADTSKENIYVDPVYKKNVVGGTSIQLTPSTTSASSLTYTYESSNTSLATVDSNGLVSTVSGANGSVTITVTASNGNTDTATFAVIPDFIKATSLSVSLADSEVAKYGITTATVTFEPADASDQNFTLTSNNENTLFYDSSTKKLVQSISAEAKDGTATVQMWVGADVSGATLTATATASENSSAAPGTASISSSSTKATWFADAGSYRMTTDIQSGSAGLWDGLVINSKADGTIITKNGKMSLKSAGKMQTRNVILYIPVEGASTVTINLASEVATSSSLYYSVGSDTSNDFTANDHNTVFTYTYSGDKTGIVLGSDTEISELTFAKTAGNTSISSNKYLKVNVVGSDRYITSIDVEKTGDFTATWDTEEQTGAKGSYSFTGLIASTSYTTSSPYTSDDGFVTATGVSIGDSTQAGHGFVTSSDSVITITVDGISQITLLGCKWGNGAPCTVSDGTNTLATYTSTNVSSDGGEVSPSAYYTSTEKGTVTIKFTGDGWIHGVKVTQLESFIPVTSISVTDPNNGTSSSISGGTTLQLTATASPSTATETSVTWTSSNTDVATVSSAGLVTASSTNTGDATITATANDGSGVKGTYSLTVTASTFNASSATVTWDLTSSSVNIQGTLGRLKGTVTGSTDYTVRALVDATVTNGKLQGNGSQHAQMNNGTIIRVPVTAGAVVSVTASSASAKYALYTIAGTTASTENLTSTYTHGASADAAWIEIVSTGTASPAKIEITGLDVANLPSAVAYDYLWSEANIVEDAVSFEKSKGYYDELYIDASNGKFVKNNTSWTQCNAGTVIYVPMNGAGTVSFTTNGAYTITGGASKDLSTTASAAVSYEVAESDLVSSGVEGDSVKYAKITFTTGGYIKNLARTYSE